MRVAGDEFKGVTSFSILLTCQYTREAVDRLVRIMNVLGDGKLIRERVSVFVSGKSVLNLMPELNELRDILMNLNTLVPHFQDIAWLCAPEAKLR